MPDRNCSCPPVGYYVSVQGALVVVCSHGSVLLSVPRSEICDVTPLKDEAPARAGAPGVEPTGCSPPSPVLHREDIPSQKTVTVCNCTHLPFPHTPNRGCTATHKQSV